MQEPGANDASTASPSGALTPKRVLIALLVAFVALGVFETYLEVRGIPEPKSVQLGSTFVFSLMTFTWFWLDSESRAYKRSPFLSVSVVALGIVAIPYYLLRSRPKGQRLKAVGKCVGFVGLLLLAFVLGSLLVAIPSVL
jgi:hypothetical protein